MPATEPRFPMFGQGPEACSLGDDLRVRLLHLGGVTLTEAWNSSDLTAPYWRFYCNLDPGAAVRVGARSFPLLPGQVWAIPAWLRWAASCRGAVRHVVMHLEVASFSRELVAALFAGPVRLPDPALAQDLVALAVEVAALDEPGFAQQCRGAILAHRALDMLVAGLDADDRGRLWRPDRHNPLAPLLAHIALNLDGDLGNLRLAAIAGCSRAHLERLFRRHLRSTPARFVRQRRVARAAELLANGDEPIETVAERCGFPNRHHLTRVFTQHLGVGPAAYRQRR